MAAPARLAQDDAQGRRVHNDLGAAARRWHSGARDPGELYRGARLAAALDWSAAHQAELSPAERAFLDQSRAASERSQRRLRAVLVGVAGLLVLAVIAGALAFDQRGNARDKAVAADAQRLGARALLENDLDTSLLLARQGVALDDSVQTRGSLLAALGKSPAAIGVMRGDGERMWELALSPDEGTLAAGDPAGNVFLFDTRTHERIATVRPRDGNAWITKLTYSPDGSRLAIAHDSPRDNVVAVLDTRSRRVLRTFTPPRPGFVTALRFTTDDKLEFTSVSFNDPEHEPADFMRYDARTGRRLLGPVRVSRHASSPLLATSDGRRLITAGDGEVAVRDAATLRVRRRYRVAGETEPRYPSGFALSPDDRTLAIGERDGAVRLLDLQTGAVRTAFRPPRRCRRGRAVHPGRPHAADRERGRQGDRVGRATGGSGRDARWARQRHQVTPGHARRPDALLRRPRRHGVHLGPRRAPGASAGRSRPAPAATRRPRP